MDTNPQSSAHAPTPNAGAPLVEYIRNQRVNAGYLFAGLAVLFLVLAGYMALKAYRSPAAAEKAPEKSVTDPFDPEKPPELPKAEGEIANLKRGDYNVGWIAFLCAFLAISPVAMWLLANPPPPEEGQQRTEARVLILAAGKALGVVAIATGLFLFYRWSDSLFAWLDRGELKEARWVMIPIMIIVLGAGLIFAAIQPARAEERNNSSIRRLVYGANFGLTILMLLVALVVANVLFAVRLPNKLDATESGFYSISENTTELLRRLDPPVTAYAILPDTASGRGIGDLRQFLNGAQDVSEGRFKVKFVNPSGDVNDKNEIKTLASKYPQLDLILFQRGSIGAVVLTAGAEEKRHAVIPNQEFFTIGRNGEQLFSGEVRLFKELTLLADNQVKPIIYFTQSNGELSIIPEDQAPDNQKGTRLRSYLEKNYLEVRPLNFARDNPTVPDDAAVVVIAGPRVEFNEAAVGALRKYINTPRPSDGKKGKLIVLAGVVPGTGGKGVMKTGLEGLLSELNVGLVNRFVYSQPIAQSPNPLDIITRFSRAILAERHPVAISIYTASNAMLLPLVREVRPLDTAPALQAKTLLEAAVPTWLEEDRIANVNAAIKQINENDTVASAKNVIGPGRPLATVVSEGPTSRAAVFGSTDIVTDELARDIPPESAPLTFDLIGVTIDWLRERPSVSAVGIEAKKYQEYRFPEPAAVDTSRLLYLPLTLGILFVVGLGAGVWVIRRK